MPRDKTSQKPKLSINLSGSYDKYLRDKADLNLYPTVSEKTRRSIGLGLTIYNHLEQDSIIESCSKKQKLRLTTIEIPKWYTYQLDELVWEFGASRREISKASLIRYFMELRDLFDSPIDFSVGTSNLALVCVNFPKNYIEKIEKLGMYTSKAEAIREYLIVGIRTLPSYNKGLSWNSETKEYIIEEAISLKINKGLIKQSISVNISSVCNNLLGYLKEITPYNKSDFIRFFAQEGIKNDILLKKSFDGRYLTEDELEIFNGYREVLFNLTKEK